MRSGPTAGWLRGASRLELDWTSQPVPTSPRVAKWITTMLDQNERQPRAEPPHREAANGHTLLLPSDAWTSRVESTLIVHGSWGVEIVRCLNRIIKGRPSWSRL